jgi:NitT/TauT family transport system permease protein/taurine transport system permease protein
MRPFFLRMMLIAAVLVLWEAVRRLDLVGPLLMASPTEIVEALTESGGQFISAFRLTLVEMACATAISWTLGVTVGVIAGLIALLGAAMGPILSALFAVPLITWYPLFMVWFGIGSASKIAYAVVSGFFPIAIGTLNGIRGVDRQYFLFARSIGCSRRQMISRVLLPVALPSIIAGLRIGTALVVIGVVVAEMLASLGGIGYLITYYRTFYATGHVYLGILLALLCALAANWGLSAFENRFMRWRDLQVSENS